MILRIMEKRTKMSDLIKKQDAIDAIGADIDEIDAFDPSAGIKKACIRRAIWKVMGVPSADRPQGEWIDHPQYGTIQCDQCTVVYNSALYPKNFCPYCGARMKGADDETD